MKRKKLCGSVEFYKGRYVYSFAYAGKMFRGNYSRDFKECMIFIINDNGITGTNKRIVLKRLLRENNIKVFYKVGGMK